MGNIGHHVTNAINVRKFIQAALEPLPQGAGHAGRPQTWQPLQHIRYGHVDGPATSTAQKRMPAEITLAVERAALDSNPHHIDRRKPHRQRFSSRRVPAAASRTSSASCPTDDAILPTSP